MILFRKLTIVFLAVVVMMAGSPLWSVTAQGRVLDRPVTLVYSAAVSYLPPELLDILPYFDYGFNQNLYLTLFSYDLETRTAVPQLAESYSVSDDGLVYTIRLRSDVQWVLSKGGQVSPVRPVTAEDAANGFYSRCQSVDFVLEAYRVIQGCDGSSRASGIQVVDDTTLTITLSEPASYLPIALTSPVVAPTPMIWQADVRPEVGKTPTNGPFVLQSLKKDEATRTFVFIRNPLLPEDLRGNGNIEQIILRLYDGQQNPQARLTTGEEFEQGLSAFLPERGGEISSPPQIVRIMVFNPEKPPFDNSQVRRAFSAAIDRTQLSEVINGELPADHFGAPAFAGSIPLDNDRMLGFDPDYARAQLAEAGYPDCAGLPPITIKVSGSQDQANQLIDQFNAVLGCDRSLFEVTEVSFDELYRTVTGDALARRFPGQVPSPTNAQRPSLWFTNTNGAPTVPDQAASIGVDLDCDRSTWGVPCTPAEALMDQANAEQDPVTRNKLWASVEEAFFGRDGEFPVAPLSFIPSTGLSAASWVQGSPLSYYGLIGNCANLVVDNVARLEVRGLSISIPASQESVAVNERVMGTIADPASATAFTVPASGEEKVSLSVVPAQGSTLDPVVNVYSSDGNFIASNDDASPLSPGAGLGGLPGDIDLTVVVSAFDAASTGDFMLQISGGALVGTVQSDGNINVRSGPGTGFAAVTTVAPGTEVQITGRNADASWLVITLDNQEGWVASFLIATESDLMSLPVVE